jgi:hypothetical protein
MNTKFTESDLIKSIALAFLQVQCFVYHPGFEKTVAGAHQQGRFSSCVALTTTDTGILSF